MRMFDVYTKTQLRQDPSFRFNNQIFQVDIILIQYHRLNRSAKKVKQMVGATKNAN